MKKSFFYINLLLTLVFLYSCKDVKQAASVKVDKLSTGKAAEVLVIAEDHYWNDALKDSVHSWLSRTQEVLNQVEPMFDNIRLDQKNFNTQHQTHRNIFYFDIKPTYTEPELNIIRDPRAKPQIWVEVKANSSQAAIEIVRKHLEEIIVSFYDNDLKRLQNFHAKNQNAYLQKIIRDKFGISLVIPNSYTVARNESDFVWLMYRTQKNDRMIAVYSTPYNGEALTGKYLVELRNQMFKAYIEGALEDAYPKVANIYDLPLMTSITNGTKSGVLLRGLWDVVGDKMGGPFINFSFVQNNRLISIDGFVYAPQENKRDYMREVESVVKSLR